MKTKLLPYQMRTIRTLLKRKWMLFVVPTGGGKSSSRIVLLDEAHRS